jgi:5'-nucleotidase
MKNGVNILIAVGHASYLKDMEIAGKVPDIDVVVGGHTNTFL